MNDSVDVLCDEPVILSGDIKMAGPNCLLATSVSLLSPLEITVMIKSL